MTRSKKTALALGGNIGNSVQHFREVLSNLTENGFTIDKTSSIYTTPAVNCEAGANDFYNCVITGYWKYSSLKLLELCQKTELLVGRPKKHSSYESRVIDIDIILFNNQTIATKDLKIPHPRAHERLFVLIPLNEIAPEWAFKNFNLKTREILNSLKNKQTDLFNKIQQSKQNISLN
jgi:2-amino-4-hydroxy-6-hydroxymethyldihydropteridine diphosphokinase